MGFVSRLKTFEVDFVGDEVIYPEDLSSQLGSLRNSGMKVRWRGPIRGEVINDDPFQGLREFSQLDSRKNLQEL